MEHKRIKATLRYIVTISIIIKSFLPVSEAYARTALSDEADAKDAFIIYTYSESVSDELLAYFYDNYPQYRDRINCVSIPAVGGDEFVSGFKAAFGDLDTATPSMVLYDGDYKETLWETGLLAPISETGISDEMLKEMYPFTLEAATHQGELMALTWKASPVGYCYRMNIAEEVFGTSDGQELSHRYFDTWDGVLDAAAELKGAGYYLVPDMEMILRCDAPKCPNEIAQEILDNGYSAELDMWSTEWMSGLKGDVFGYLIPPWAFSLLFLGVDTDIENDDMAVCSFPGSYYWGETYISVTRECSDMELAKLILKTLCCDGDAMYEMGINDEWSLINNRSAVERMIENNYMPWSDLPFGTDDVLSVYDAVAIGIGAKSKEERGMNDEEPLTYMISQGDCLWNIAKRFYGDGIRYTDIYEANREDIEACGGNENLIYPGHLLVIP